MIRLLDSLKMPTYLVPLAEPSDDEYYVFGMKYLKAGFTPLAFQHFFISGSVDSLMLKKAVYLGTNGTGAGSITEMPLFRNVIRKRSDGGIRYFSDYKDVSYIGSTKVRDIDNTTIAFKEIIYTCDTFDIVIGTTKGTANANYLYLCKNMDSTAMSTLYSANVRVNYTFLDEDSTNVYILATLSNGALSIIVVNKNTFAATVQTTSGTTNLTTGPSTTLYTKHKVVDYMIQTDPAIIKIPIIYINASSVTVVRVVTYNKSLAGTDAVAKCTIEDYTISGTLIAPTTNVHSVLYKAIDANTVAVFYGVQGTGVSVGSVPLTSFGIFTISFDHTDKIATIGSMTQTNALQPLAPMFDGATLYTVSSTGYAKSVYDSKNKKYIKLQEVACNPACVGLDSKGYIWVYTADNCLDVYTPYAIKRVVTRCDYKAVTYLGVDIDIPCYVSTYNYEGNRAAGTVKLTVYGDAVFKANGLTTLEITSATDGDTTAIVTIKGDGNIKVVGEVSGSIS